MSFDESFQTVAGLLGKQNAALLDQHASQLAGKADTDAVSHFETCSLADWCALNTTLECRDRLNLIEWGLDRIAAVIAPQKFQSAYSQKAKNRDQFYQFVAEIATAATCAVGAKLLDLEWLTGKGNCDADVRVEICNEPVNLEVTLRTDSWLKEITVHMEDIFDKEGNQIAEMPVAKSRRTMTDRGREDLTDSGIALPICVSDVIEEGKKSPRKMECVSDVNDLPPVEKQSKAYCADGDNPNVESSNVQRCIREKAAKFLADGNHFVVVATIQPGFPSEHCVFDAVFGQASQIKHHGIFESGLHNEICGVLYLPVFQQLQGLKERDQAEHLARLFLNHHATRMPSESVMNGIAEIFGAQVRRGWIDVEKKK